MEHFTETDYSELIDYIIEQLEHYGADDLVRQIKELEKASVIEKAEEEQASFRKLPPANLFIDWENLTGRPSKKLIQGTVSEYSSRPMRYEEMYYAAIDILEAYLLTVPDVIRSVKKRLAPSPSQRIFLANESAHRIGRQEELTDITQFTQQLDSGIQPEMAQIIAFLKDGPGKERI